LKSPARATRQPSGMYPSISQPPSLIRPCSVCTPSGSETLPVTLTQVWGTPTCPNVCGLPFQTSMSGPPVAVQADVVNDESFDVVGLPSESEAFTRNV
jgi:hypothetical protein